MKLKRLFRDGGILIAFSVAFYFLIVLVNRLDGDTDEGTDFSYTRKQADLMVARRDWRRAATQFKKLTDKDPYDGRAWYMQAISHDELMQNAQRDLNQFSSGTNPDSQKVEDARRRFKNQGDLAVEHYLIAREFPRYRKNSLFQAASIESNRGNYENAIDALKEFVDNGFVTKNGIVKDKVFGTGDEKLLMLPLDQIPPSARLHAIPKFWSIGRIEMASFARQ